MTEGNGVVSYWVVCVTPPDGHGTLDMTTAVWPGGVTSFLRRKPGSSGPG